MNIQCAQCGLTNFAAATACRRCGGSLDAGAFVAEPIPFQQTGPPAQIIDHDHVELRNSASHWLWFGAALQGLAMFGVLRYASQANPSQHVSWAPLIAPALLVIAGVLCRRGIKAGMWLAALPLLGMMCAIPVGTILALVIAQKVSKAAKLGALG